MAATRPWESFQGLTAFQSRARDCFDRISTLSWSAGDSWVPPADVCETGEEVIISFDLPGLEQGEVALELEGRLLTVSGARARPEREAGSRLHRFERSFGPFSRQIELPCAAGAHAEIGSSYEDGVLEIRVAKATDRQPARIAAVADDPTECGADDRIAAVAF